MFAKLLLIVLITFFQSACSEYWWPIEWPFGESVATEGVNTEVSQLDNEATIFYSRKKPIFDEKDIEQNGGPIVMGCIHGAGQELLTMAKSDNETAMTDLINKLGNTGRNISFYFMGIGMFLEENEKRYNYKGWYKQSGTNICYISYANKETKPIQLIYHVPEIFYTRRVQFVAKLVCDFAIKVRDACKTSGSKCLHTLEFIEALGYSVGSYMASFFGRCMEHRTGEKIGKIIGLEPSAAGVLLSEPDFIKSGDALYVQTIHTTRSLGTTSRLADSNIEILYDCSVWNAKSNHQLARFIHEITSTRQAILIAVEKPQEKAAPSLEHAKSGKTNGEHSKEHPTEHSKEEKSKEAKGKEEKGKVEHVVGEASKDEHFKGRWIKLDDEKHEHVVLADNECVIGVYNEDKPKPGQAGKVYELSLKWKGCKILEEIDLNPLGNPATQSILEKTPKTTSKSSVLQTKHDTQPKETGSVSPSAQKPKT